MKSLLTLALLGSLLGAASARPVAIGGVPTSPVIETKPLSGDREGLPVWFLPRLGLQTRNNPQDLWLSYGTRSLRYTPQAGWVAAGFSAAPLPPPERYGEAGSLHVALDVLRALGVPLSGDAQQLNVTVRRVGIEPPLPPVPQVALVGTGVGGSAAAKPAASTVKSSAPSRTALPGTLAQAAPPALRSASVVPTPLTPAPAPSTLPKPVSTTPDPTPGPPVVPATPAPAPAPSPLPVLSGPSITGVRSSLTSVRNVQVQRLVIDLSGPVTYNARNERGGVTVFLPQVNASPSVQTLESGDTLTLAPDERGVTLRLDAGGGLSQVMTLDDPDRLVIDTATSLSADVPPPVKEDALPDGVSLSVFGGLSLLSFDPARYVPHVVTAPSGAALSVAELVQRGGGVAGVNGGYFDPPSSLPVDFVAVGGKLLSASLERRGTVGFDERGAALFGFPRPRYVLSGAFGSLMVNTVTSRATPKLLTAFVGDGKTAVGGAGLLTLTLNAQATSIVRADMNGSVPAAGLISLSFDPSRFPQLPRTVGTSLQASLNYQTPEWQHVREGLSAGPMLLQGGEIVLNPEREAFNVLTGVWRPTRQVAFAVYKGRPTLAFLEFGTPETFARALHSVGVQDALRLDSGSSATVFVQGGYLGSGGYLNSVWSRPVPNAIVLVPVDSAKALTGGSKNLR